MTKRSSSRKAQPQRRPHSIALCVIARNEEEFIASCLDSARPFVDEIVVVDTGSTDATVEIARAHGARVEHFEWCEDFAAARNAAIESATADWILMLDADEELDSASGSALRDVVGKPLPHDLIGYSVMIENRLRNGSEDSIRHCVTRLFPRNTDLRYVGAIHEDLFRLSDRRRSGVMFLPEVRVFHYGYDPEVYVARDKDARNLRMLEAALLHEGENARLLYHLGQQHLVAQRYADAVAAFERFEPLAEELARHYLVDTYRMWLQCLAAIGDGDAVERVTSRAQSANALSAQARHLLGAHELKNNRLGLALRYLLSALDSQAPIGVAAEPGVGGWRTRLLLADAYIKLDEPESALEQLDLAQAEAPQDRRATIALDAARVASVAEATSGTLRRVDTAVALAADELQVQVELLQLRLNVLRGLDDLPQATQFDVLDGALAYADWQAAYDAAMTLPLCSNSALARLLYLASELRGRRAPDAALDLLGRAVDTYPASPVVYWPLIQVLSDLERWDDALAATEILKKVPETLAKAA